MPEIKRGNSPLTLINVFTVSPHQAARSGNRESDEEPTGLRFRHHPS